jgi:hypothetical protein
LFYIKAHLVTLIEALESGHVDLGMVDEHIATVFLLNETESLFITEPLYDSFCHSDLLLSNKFPWFQTEVATFDKWIIPFE